MEHNTRCHAAMHWNSMKTAKLKSSESLWTSVLSITSHPSDRQDDTGSGISHEDIRKKVAEMYSALKKEDWKLFEISLAKCGLQGWCNDPVVGADKISKTLQYIYKILKLTTHNQRGLWKADDDTVIIEMDANYVNKLIKNSFRSMQISTVLKTEKLSNGECIQTPHKQVSASWFNK